MKLTCLPTRVLSLAFAGFCGTALVQVATAKTPVKPICAASALKISIGTYNVENFWDDTPGNSTPYDDFGPQTSNWYSDEIYLVKAKHVAEALQLAGAPDIMALEELESGFNNSHVLELLKPELENMGYKYFALGQQNSADPTAVTTGVISKFPILSNERLDFVGPTNGDSGSVGVNVLSSARDPQVVTVDVSGTKVRVYASHWKSRLGDFAAGEAMRVAIAKLIKADIDSVRAKNPTLDVVVMGDFNSDQSERPMVSGLQLANTKEALKNTTASNTYDLWFELQESDRCSYVFKGQRQCIDHIVVNSTAFDGKGLDFVEGSFRVVGHGDAAEKTLVGSNGTPYRWQERKNKGFTSHPGEGYSDHLPLVADFILQTSVGGQARTCK